MILEEEAHAKQRGANILGRVLGAGSSCAFDRNGHVCVTRALVNAMRVAIRDAGLTPDQIGHINAHGLGTPQMDRDEARAIHEVFGPGAEKIPVTALKSSLGNSGASCGTIELAGSLAGLTQGVVPPTLNYRVPDPECRLDIVPDKPRPVANRIFLNVNVTAMGQASVLVVEAAVIPRAGRAAPTAHKRSAIGPKPPGIGPKLALCRLSVVPPMLPLA